MFCTNCGKVLNPGDRFCANCGCEIKASQSEQRRYDNVVFNPPFRKEADKRTAQILKNREEFTGFKDIANENSRRNSRSKAKMDWNLEGFPESITAKNKSGFDWNSVVERRNSGRSMGLEKIDLSSTIEHKKIDDTQVAAKKAEPFTQKDNLGLPPEDSRVISLEELEKELYDLEEDLKTDTAGTNQYQPFDVENDDELDAYLDGIPKTKNKEKEAEEQKLEQDAIAAVKMGGPMKWNLSDNAPKGSKVSMAPMGLKWGIDASEVAAKRKAAKTALKKEREMVWDTDAKPAAKPAVKTEEKPAPAEPVAEPTLIHNPFKEPEIAVQPEPEPAPEPVVEPEPVFQPEPEVIPEPETVMPEPEAVMPEPEVPAEPVPVKEEIDSSHDFDFSSIKAPTWDMDAEENKEPLEDFKFNFPLDEEKPAVEEVKFEAPEAETPLEETEAPAEAAEELISDEAPAEEAITGETPVEEVPAEDVPAEESPAAEIEDEFNDMLVDSDDDENTKMIDHSAIKQMLDEYKMRLRAEKAEAEAAAEAEVETPAETEEPEETEGHSIAAEAAGIAAAAGIATAASSERPLWQEDLIHPWESREEEAPAEEAEAPEEVQEEAPAEEVSVEEEPAEEVPAEEEPVEETPAEEEPVEETPEEEVPAEEVPEEEAPAEEVPEEEAPAEETEDAGEPEAEPETEETAEPVTETEELEAEEELSAEELAYEEQAEETAEAEVTAETPEEEAPAEEKPMFYTFSQKNDAFQQLLDRERDRLNGLGTDYMPLNAEARIEKIVNPADTPAYEENGVYVENVIQPGRSTVADVSGDAQPEAPHKYNFMTDGDWLKEMKSAKDMDSLNKAKLRYSDLFPTPVTEHSDTQYGLSDDEESMKEKQRKAEELDKIFEDDDSNTDKPGRHIVGNIIMILLILLILFEGSVLAAKLIAPDSKYAHISDVAVEKVLNLLHGKDQATDEGEATDDIDIDDAVIEEGAYSALINDLSKDAKTIGQVVYNENLNYSKVAKSSFEGVESLDTLKDSEWKDGTTYAGGIYKSVIDYYNEWKDRNTDESLIGIDSLELGEIKESKDGYYVLSKAMYATSDGSKAATYQTCFVTLIDNNMFIDEIKGETVDE